MNRFLILLVFLSCTYLSASAQNLTWKQHAKTAEQALAKRAYKDAAEQFEMAWRRKTDKLEYLMRSGEAYLIVRDFRKAAEVFRIVRDRTSIYKKATYKYALCLKQQGKYPEALVEFRKFRSEYDGVDKAFMQERCKKEIEGCELAKAMKAQAATSGLKLEHLDGNVNTLEAEFAPIPFSDDILYFSSTMAGKANIFRTQRKAGQWIKSSIPKGLPTIEGAHVCNGAFAPDLSRFYFTVCKSNPVWGDLSTQCEIYMTKKTEKDWTAPQRLPDYVNETGATTTHPYVIHQEGKEILYFSSNREGGQGGMDIWYMERGLEADGVDFSYPANTGLDINTSGDEVTPFYSVDDNMLFFSSNGKVNIGGFDIYTATGSKAFWEKPQLLSYPINSSADDYFYRTKPNSLDGFFVSNRTYGMEKITTTQEDIFAFYQPVAKAFVSGMIQDKLSKKPIPNVQVSLYELLDNEHLRLLEAKVTDNGAYEFGLIPNRRFRVEARKAGYKTSQYDFETDALESLKKFGQSLLLQKMPTRGRASANSTATRKPQPEKADKKTEQVSRITSNSSISKTKHAINTSAKSKVDTTSTPSRNEKIKANTVLNNTEKEYTAKAKTPGEPYPYTSKAIRHQGIYYKVQLIAVVKFDVNQNRYNSVRQLGQFNTEYIPKMKLTRVLMGDYFDLEEAQKVLEVAVKNKSFHDAYIVRYENGKRIGRWL